MRTTSSTCEATQLPAIHTRALPRLKGSPSIPHPPDRRQQRLAVQRVSAAAQPPLLLLLLLLLLHLLQQIAVHLAGSRADVWVCTGRVVQRVV